MEPSISTSLESPRDDARRSQSCKAYAGKRAIDLVAIVVSVLVLAIPLLSLYFLVLWDVGRPAFFRQVRVGRHRRPFTLYKFRSMTEPGDAGDELLPDCQRVTSLGRHLRRYRLDEWPELFNVLRGDLSLVGPRPLPPVVVATFGPLAAKRCSVRPGLTGWAQVHGNTLLSSEEKLALDLWYVRHCSLWRDIQILIKTANVVFRGEKRNEAAIRSARRLCGTS